MNTFSMSKFYYALMIIAKKEGRSIKEIYNDMQTAIDMGYSNPDPGIQAAWKDIPLPSGKPKTEDIVAHCIKNIKK